MYFNRLMINYVNDSNEPEWKGYFYAAMMFLAAVIQSILLHQYFHRCFVVGMRVRTAVIATVYRKVDLHAYSIPLVFLSFLLLLYSAPCLCLLFPSSSFFSSIIHVDNIIII